MHEHADFFMSTLLEKKNIFLKEQNKSNTDRFFSAKFVVLHVVIEMKWSTANAIFGENSVLSHIDDNLICIPLFSREYNYLLFIMQIYLIKAYSSNSLVDCILYHLL